MDDHEVEAVALAFYNVMEGARGWPREPETLKAKFRAEARAAIVAIDEFREISPDLEQHDLIRLPSNLSIEKKLK
jgi:sensor domain CHASE-containing protein